jgi:hypothetical protein
MYVALAGTWSAAVGEPLADHFQELHEYSRGVVLAPSDQEIETRGGRVQRHEYHTGGLSRRANAGTSATPLPPPTIARSMCR